MGQEDDKHLDDIIKQQIARSVFNLVTLGQYLCVIAILLLLLS
jgi:hypothetical protein